MPPPRRPAFRLLRGRRRGGRFAAEFFGEPVGSGARPGQLGRVGEGGADRGAGAFGFGLDAADFLEYLVAVGAEIGELVLQPGDQADGRLAGCQVEFGFRDPYRRDGHAVEPQVRTYLIAGAPGGRADDGESAEHADVLAGIAGTVAFPGLGDLGAQRAAQAGGGVGPLAEYLPVEAHGERVAAGVGAPRDGGAELGGHVGEAGDRLRAVADLGFEVLLGASPGRFRRSRRWTSESALALARMRMSPVASAVTSL